MRKGDELAGATVAVGFIRDPLAARVAAELEFGSHALPERPAMRQSQREVTDAIRDVLPEGLRTLPAPAVLQEVADVAAEAMRKSYIKSGQSGALAPVSAKRAERKAGTPGVGRVLVGTRGPKLIERIRAEVRRG